eukprot:751908-Rhodomonas_salina.1
MAIETELKTCHLAAPEPTLGPDMMARQSYDAAQSGDTSLQARAGSRPSAGISSVKPMIDPRSER